MGSTEVDKRRTLATKGRKAAEVATAIQATLEFLRNLPTNKLEQLAQSGKTIIETNQTCLKLFNDLSRPEQEEAAEIIRRISKFVGLKVVFNSSSMKMTVGDPSFNNDDSLLSFVEKGLGGASATAGG